MKTKSNIIIYILFNAILFINNLTNVAATESEFVRLMENVEAGKLSAMDVVDRIAAIYLSGAKIQHSFDSRVAEYISYGRITTNSVRLPTPDDTGYLFKDEEINGVELNQMLRLFSAAAANGSKLSAEFRSNILYNVKDTYKQLVNEHIKNCLVVSYVAEEYFSDPSQYNLRKQINDGAYKHVLDKNFDSNDLADFLEELDSNVSENFKNYIEDAKAKKQKPHKHMLPGIKFLTDEKNIQQVDEVKQPLFKDIYTNLVKNDHFFADKKLTLAIDELRSACQQKIGVTEALNNTHKLLLLNKVTDKTYAQHIFQQLIYYYFIFSMELVWKIKIPLYEIGKAYEASEEPLSKDWINNFLVEIAKKSYYKKGYSYEELLRYSHTKKGLREVARSLWFEFLVNTGQELNNFKKLDKKTITNIISGFSIFYYQTDNVHSSDQTKMITNTSDNYNFEQAKKIRGLTEILKYYFDKIEKENQEVYNSWFDEPSSGKASRMSEIKEYLLTIQRFATDNRIVDNNKKLLPLSSLDKKDLDNLYQSLVAAVKIFFKPFYSKHDDAYLKFESLLNQVNYDLVNKSTKVRTIVDAIEEFEFYAVAYNIYHNIDELISVFSSVDSPKHLEHRLRISLTAEDDKSFEKDFVERIRIDYKKSAISINKILEELISRFGTGEIPVQSLFEDEDTLPADATGLYNLVKDSFANSNYSQTKSDASPFRGNIYLEQYEFSELFPLGVRTLDIKRKTVQRDLIFIMFLLNYNLDKIKTIMGEVMDGIPNYSWNDYRKNFELPLRRLMAKYSHDANSENSKVTKRINLAVDFLKQLLNVR